MLTSKKQNALMVISQIKTGLPGCPRLASKIYKNSASSGIEELANYCMSLYHIVLNNFLCNLFYDKTFFPDNVHLQQVKNS